MLFFKKILRVGQGMTGGSERRDAARYPVYPQFPIKAVLNVAGRDTMGHVLKAKDGGGWDWSGKLVNLSSTGARIQLPPSVEAQRNDPCQLKLDVQGYVLKLPGTIAHLGERLDTIVYGLKLDLAEPTIQRAYDQLLDLVALGASLKPTKVKKSGSEGYLCERYEGAPGTHLDVWRHTGGKELAAFEFVLRDSLVRGLADRPGVECLSGTKVATAKRPTPAQGAEILRLFQWVVLNLSPAMPADVTAFLHKHGSAEAKR